MNAAVRQRILESTRTWCEHGTHHLEFTAMATRCRVSVATTDSAAMTIQRDVLEWVAGFESRYSRFLPDSILSHINAAAGKDWVSIDEETERIFKLCHEAHFITRGVFDPTALPLIQLWDWKANPPVIPSDEQIAEAKKRVGWMKVQRVPGKIFLPAGMCIDLGGIGKEYAVDVVAAMAVQGGVRSALIDFGQDVMTLGVPADGRPAWHIGLEDPKRPGTCWGSVGVRDMAVATSGDYLRRFEVDGRRYGHIIDARDGRPVSNGQRSVSILAPTCTMAGVLATAAFVLGVEDGLRLIDSIPGVAGCILTDTQRIQNRKFHEYFAV